MISNSGFGQSQAQNPGTPPGPPFPLNSADNGLSVDPITGRIVLGQSVGEAGDPAVLLGNREIPLDLNLVSFRGVPYNADFHRVAIDDNSVTIYGENDSGFGSFFRLNDLNTGITGSLSNGGAGITLQSDGNININAQNAGSVSIAAAGDSNSSILLAAPTAMSGADIAQVAVTSAFNTAGRPAMMGFDLNPISQAAGSEFIRFSINGTEVMGIDLAGDIQKFTTPFRVYANGLPGLKVDNVGGANVTTIGDVNDLVTQTKLIVDDSAQQASLIATNGLLITGDMLAGGLHVASPGTSASSFANVDLTNDVGDVGLLFLTASTYSFFPFYGPNALGFQSGGTGGIAFGAVNAAGNIRFSAGSAANEVMRIKPTTIVNITGMQTFATEAAAIIGGLVTGDLYKNAAGVVSIVN